MPDAAKKTRRVNEQQRTIRGLKPDPQHPWRHENIGRLLLASVINWQDVLVRGLQEKGFRQFRASHMNLLRHIDLRGTRITEIADRSRLSKQAVGQLVANCEAQKLVKTISDSTDRRAKIVTFTNLGRTVIDAERDVMESMDAELTVVLGVEGFADLRRSLALLSEWIGPFGAGRKTPSPSKSRRKHVGLAHLGS
jgi:DNA-binding MarR family transcriptional regulator